jgi:transcriptional repressor NF-X1
MLRGGVRTSCMDPIPTCESTCGKVHTTCSHSCLSTCHVGECPPCTVSISVSCRCGETIRYVPCFERRAMLEAGEGEVLCNTKCTGMRHCGRHACSRLCCPLAALSKLKTGGKGKKRVAAATDGIAEDVEGWHNCDLVCTHSTSSLLIGRQLLIGNTLFPQTCNKRLSCGNHFCAEPDHRGPCPPCLQSSFEEVCLIC